MSTNKVTLEQLAEIITPNYIFKNGKLLTIEVAKTLIGKKIYWTATVYKSNNSFVGLSTILSIDDSRSPIKSKNHNDNWLNLSFLPYHHWSSESIQEMIDKYPNTKEDFTALNYGDTDREIYFIESL